MSKPRGDGVYKRKDRPGYWISWTDAQGRRRQRKTNAGSLSQARARLSAERMRTEQAKILGFMPPGEDSFEELAERFLSFQKARVSPAEHEREESVFRQHLKRFFPGKVASIRKVDIDRYITNRSGEVAAATVRREVVTLKHALSKAVDWEIIPINPAQKVELPKEPPGRVRYLQPTELRCLLQECPEWLRPIVGLAVTTGMRRSEILKLRWLDIDFEHRCVLLPQTKNGEGRIVYLNESAVAAISSLPAYPSAPPLERLFPAVSPAKVTVTFARACVKAGIEDFRFHDLRHTAASWLRMKGADIHTVALLLGHKDLRMAARYQHLSKQFLADAVRGLDAVFGDLRYQDVTKPVGLIEAEAVNV
jgi:integrase